MAKKKRKNNVSKPMSDARAFEMLRPLVEPFESIEIPLEDVYRNSRFIKQRATQLWINKSKRNGRNNRMMNLIESWLEKLSKRYGIATIEKELFSHLLSNLIAHQTEKISYAKRLTLLQTLNVATREGCLDTATTSSLMKPISSDSNFQISTLDLNHD